MELLLKHQDNLEKALLVSFMVCKYITNNSVDVNFLSSVHFMIHASLSYDYVASARVLYSFCLSHILMVGTLV
jgi:hypothetical protein